MTLEQVATAGAIFWGSVAIFLILWATMIKERPVYESKYTRYK